MWDGFVTESAQHTGASCFFKVQAYPELTLAYGEHTGTRLYTVQALYAASSAKYSSGRGAGATAYQRWRTMWASSSPTAPWATKPMRSRRLRPSYSEGRMMMDALLTQRHITQMVGDKGGDEVMIIKENQLQLRAEIALVFPRSLVGDRQSRRRLSP